MQHFESRYYPSENGISIFSRDISGRGGAELPISTLKRELAEHLADMTTLYNFVARLDPCAGA